MNGGGGSIASSALIWRAEIGGAANIPGTMYVVVIEAAQVMSCWPAGSTRNVLRFCDPHGVCSVAPWPEFSWTTLIEHYLTLYEHLRTRTART